VDLEISGRTALVTGASRGIGCEVARLLVAEGANVLMVARGADDLEVARRKCGRTAAGGARLATLAADVTAPDTPERCADAAESLGAVDILVNNAGQAVWRDLGEIPEGDWQAAVDLNVTAPRLLMDRFAPGMAERGWGRVVNVSSTAGKRPSPQIAEYSVAKAALLSLSRTYADRYARAGVLVNAVCPGPTASEMWMEPGGLLEQSARMTGAEDREEALATAGAGRPIGRLARPEEIAAPIVFLCSERASYVAGAAWSVDGGTVQVII
jgi:NAD(P)-dependent dehydrogenase (short-subunit alcohol dehydrogenase family)